MYQVATITSKRQLTIPADMYRKMNFDKRQKVILFLDADGMRVQPAEQLVEQLAGSLTVPAAYRGKDVTTIIARAKRAYLSPHAGRSV